MPSPITTGENPLAVPQSTAAVQNKQTPAPKMPERTILRKIESIDILEKRISTLESDFSALKSVVDRMRMFFP